MEYIAKTLNEDASLYTIAICTYALHLADHSFKQNTFNLLDSKAQTGNDTKWWAEPVSKSEEKNPWNHLPKSLDIETTSYALLTFLERNLLDDALPAVNWLIQQQNSLGGFTSSQDTVIGMIALYKVVSKLNAGSNIEIEYAFNKGQGRFTINRDNSMIDQRMKVSLR